MIEDTERLHVRHIREAELCMTGARVYFRQQGWSWAEFINDGILISKVEAAGDIYALKVAAVARKEYEDGRR